MPVQKIEEGNLEYSPLIKVEENNRKSFTFLKKKKKRNLQEVFL